jgi:hypothetical protein
VTLVPDTAKPLPKGVLVTHAKFGRGHVVELRSCGARQRYLVRFDDGVARLIMQAFLVPVASDKP